MAFEALLLGDMHLDKMRKLFGERSNELILNEYDKGFQYAYDNAIPLVVIEGDICERSRMSYDAQCRLMAFLFRWDGKLEIHIILGNHDFDEDGVNSLQPLQVLADFGKFKTVHIHSRSTQLEIDGVTCNFLAWPSEKPLRADRQPLNFAHFETAGSIGDNGRVLKHGAEVSEKHLFWNGHLHTPHTSGNVHYVGTLYQTSFGERLPKSMTHLRAKYDSTGKRLVIKETRVPFEPDMQLHNVVVKSKRDLKQVCDPAAHPLCSTA
jgi:hypothetical protein